MINKNYIMRMEADRPTFNSLKYLTRVRPHYLQRDQQIVDPYVKEAIEDLIGSEYIESLGDYTRSYYTIEGHYYNLWKYDQIIQPKPKDPLLDQAIKLARQTFKLDHPVTSYTWDKLGDVPYIKTSSAGWGYYGKKGDFNNHDLAIKRAVFSLKAWLEGRSGYDAPFRIAPDLAFTRTQLGSINSPKIRHIWGESFENIILEGMSAAPLIKAYQEVGFPMPIGIHLYKRLPIIIQETLYSNDEYRTAIGIDIAGFDSSVQPWLIRESFDILRDNIIFPGFYERMAFEYSIEHFIRKPVVMPDGRMWLKQTGVPSGSYFTQLIDSAANLIATYYAQLKVYGRVFKTWILGDDSIFGIPYDIDRKPSIDAFCPHYEKLNFKIHPDKCLMDSRADTFEFLGHGARGTKVSREVERTMRLALYPENPVAGPAVSLSRIRGLMLDSGLSSWPIVDLNNYMSAKYQNLMEFREMEYPPEDQHWMQSVVGHSFTPSDIDIVRAWTFT